MIDDKVAQENRQAFYFAGETGLVKLNSFHVL